MVVTVFGQVITFGSKLDFFLAQGRKVSQFCYTCQQDLYFIPLDLLFGIFLEILMNSCLKWPEQIILDILSQEHSGEALAGAEGEVCVWK